MELREIIEFLKTLPDTVLQIPPSVDLKKATVGSLRPDTEARPGDVSWISSRTYAEAPLRIAGFQGTLLICPMEGVKAVGDAGTFVVCGAHDPKGVFTRVFHEFFADDSVIDWSNAGPVHPSSIVHSSAKLGRGVVVGPGVVIGENVEIAPNTVIANARIAANVRIGANCTIGLTGFGYTKREDGGWDLFPHIGKVDIESDVDIGSNTCIDRGSLGDTIIRYGTKIDNLVHVAHNCHIGPSALLIANAMIGGSTVIGEGAWVAPGASINNKLHIGPGATIGTGAVVVKDVAAGVVVVGNPAKPLPPKKDS